jgi:two-component system, LytTR family, response regulator
MKSLRAILVDDEPLCRQDLRDVLLAFPHVQICGEAATITEAATLLKKSMPDLIFLDLSLGPEMGFNLLQGRSFPGAVIAVTAHAEHAATAFDLDITDYLLKPVAEDRLHQALLRAQRKLNNPKNTRPVPKVIAEVSGKKVLISADEIHQIEANGNYIFLHLTNGKGIMRSTLRAILRRLPKNSFLQASRGRWISRAQISGWSRSLSPNLSLTLRDKTTVSVSRRHAKAILNAIKPPPPPRNKRLSL